MSIKGPSGKRAIGSGSLSATSLASIVSQRELYITRAEKNKVGNATCGLATIAPNEISGEAIDPMANAVTLSSFGRRSSRPRSFIERR